MPPPKIITAITGALLALAAVVASATDDFEDPPIRYSTVEPTDPVAKLHERLAAGTFDFDRSGDQKTYLRSVLKELGVPEASQILVFSKTSFQNDRISPLRPRALYYSDDFYVGWVQGGDIEIVSNDPELGPVFYRIEVPKSPDARTQIVRDNDCLRCHAGLNRDQVPGLLVRSVYTDDRGFPILSAGTFFTEHSSRLKDRWGGWYVTGNHGEMRHMGNSTATENEDGSAQLDNKSHFNLKTLAGLVNTEPYIRDDSDIVALMVLEHQVTAHNALIAASYGARQILHRNRALAEILDHGPDEFSDTTRSVLEHQATDLLKALLFTDEFKLEGFGIEGNDAFVEGFRANARETAEGRSLKDLQLLSRLFKNRCSYMIYTSTFTNLPPPFKAIVFRQLKEILDADSPPEEFQHLSQGERRRIKQILTETLEGLPADWDDTASAPPTQ